MKRPWLDTVTTVFVYLLALLSAAAGIAKILQAPQEVEFLGAIGITGIAVSLLGAVQVLGAVLMLFARSRRTGAIIAAIGFAVSSIALFVGGNISFALVSILPVVALLIFIVGLKERRGTTV